jgi:predicted ATPase/DNA-binding winged helix-turn-helix (wHTH) protein
MTELRSAQTGEAVAFGPFRLVAAEQRLLEGDRPVTLGSRALGILMTLVDHAGDLVSKEALIARVWPATFVDENNLRVHVTALRKALRDGRDGGRYILTIPGRGYRFVAPVTRSGPPPAEAATVHAPPSMPVALARTVGRDNVIAAICAQLRQRRLVTLVGAGGIGKTTVAVAIARAVASSYRDGAEFVDLAKIGDPSLIASAIAAVLGLSVHSDNPLPGILVFLRHRQMLLVLDNCEHVIEAAAATAEDIVNAAPHVRVLATSREPLRAAEERVHRLPPLESPSASAGLTAAQAMEFPSVELFVERAAASFQDFRLTDENAPVVADICRRLDGIALAIEFAASRVAAFSLRELAARLDDRFQLLTTGRRTALPRHQTLEATLDWSYQLLPDPERMLLRHLAVFSGEFSLEAAIAVMPESSAPRVADHIADLVAKSLVVADFRGDQVQYRLLDTTRLYSQQKLRGSGEYRQAAMRHADHFRHFFARAEPESDTLAKEDWLTRFASQIGNLRAALDWAFAPEGNAMIGVALTIVAIPLWVELSLMAECRGWVERALGEVSDDGTGDGARARMQLSAALGWSRMFAAAPSRETSAAWSETLVLAERFGDTEFRSKALWGLWVDSLNSGELPKALDLAREFDSTVARSANAIDRIMADRILGTSLHFMGDQVGASRHIAQVLARYVPPGRRSQIVRFQFDQEVTARYFHARILWLRGFADQAMRVVRTTIDQAQALGHSLSLASVLGQGACPITLLSGDLDAAERYADMLAGHTDRHALRLWHVWARCFMGLVMVRRGEVAAGLKTVHDQLETAGNNRFLPRYLLLLGEYAGCLGAAGDFARGLDTVEGALARCDRSGEQWYRPELLRIRGELIRAAGKDGADGVAEDHFLRALDLARRQGASAWELRAAISLAELSRDPGRAASAHTALAAIVDRFSEGFDTGDLRAARALLGGRDGPDDGSGDLPLANHPSPSPP